MLVIGRGGLHTSVNALAESFATDGLCDRRQVGPAWQHLTARLAAGTTSAWVSFFEDKCLSVEEDPGLCVHEDVSARLQLGT